MEELVAHVYLGEGKDSVAVAAVTITYSRTVLEEKAVDKVLEQTVAKVAKLISDNLNNQNVRYT